MIPTFVHCDFCGEDTEGKDLIRSDTGRFTIKLNGVLLMRRKYCADGEVVINDFCKECHKKFLALFSEKAKERIMGC